MKMVLTLLLILLSSCQTDRLVPAPPIPCYPSQEICNGKDDDCDEQVDEDLNVNCSNSCGSGVSLCVNGEYTKCSAPVPVHETCNGLDDDCDGQVDEYEDLEIKPCYPGDPKDLYFGACHFGVTRCVGGRNTCVGFSSPRPEVCNGKDDDCDGAIDEGTTKKLDLVIAIDYSGSMEAIIPQIAQAVSDWTLKYPDDGTLRVALIGVPADDFSKDFKVTLMLDMTTPRLFSDEVAKHNRIGGGASEATLDAIWLVARLDNPLFISWRDDASRALVMFTDEPPQSYIVPEVTEDDARTEVMNSGINVTVLSSDPSWYNFYGQFVPSTSIGKKLDDIVYAGSCN